MENTESQPKIVRTAIERIRNIHTLPEIAIRIRELLDDPECTADKVDQLICTDPALSARILRVVNSSFYGMPGQFSSVKRAVIFLGLNAIKNITIAASLNKMFKAHPAMPNFHAEDLWMHSVAVGVLSQQIALRAGNVASDDAFLAGLIHDVGIIVELQACRNEFAEVLKRCSKDKDLTLREAESQVFGVTHEEFGAELCRAWRFPGQLIDVTSRHHNPETLPEHSRIMPRIVHLADLLANKAGKHAAPGAEGKVITSDLLDKVGVTIDDLSLIAKELPDRIAEVKQVYTA